MVQFDIADTQYNRTPQSRTNNDINTFSFLLFFSPFFFPRDRYGSEFTEYQVSNGEQAKYQQKCRPFRGN